jgi:hypothetical protein
MPDAVTALECGDKLAARAVVARTGANREVLHRPAVASGFHLPMTSVANGDDFIAVLAKQPPHRGLAVEVGDADHGESLLIFAKGGARHRGLGVQRLGGWAPTVAGG